jgi:hypothetical protein
MPKRQQSKRWRAIRKGKPAADRGPSFDADLPVAGCYQVRLRQGGPPVALRIWHGPPLDPETLDEMDRAPGWQAQVNGVQMADVFAFWPACARRPISQAEHDRIAERSRTMDKDDPFYDPLRPIDRLKTPVPF